MSKEITSNEAKLSFNKGYTPKGFADEVFHLHLRYKGNWDELYFRDYLREHPEVVEKYVDYKKSLLDTYKYNRDAYTQAKTEFILKYTKQARTEYGERYITVEKNLRINCE